MGQAPSSIQNIVVTQAGNRWDVDFEWNNTPDQSGGWTLFESQFPRDFGDLSVDDVDQVMLELGLAVFRAQNVIPDDE